MYNEGWAVEEKRNAQAYLNTLMSFYSLVTLQRSLLYIKEAVVGPSQDIASRVGAQIKALRLMIMLIASSITAAESQKGQKLPLVCLKLDGTLLQYTFNFCRGIFQTFSDYSFSRLYM